MQLKVGLYLLERCEKTLARRGYVELTCRVPPVALVCNPVQLNVLPRLQLLWLYQALFDRINGRENAIRLLQLIEVCSQ